MNEKTIFILVDDDAINNMLSEMTLEDEFPEAKTISFTDPREGLDYFIANFSESNSYKTFLFLDINMPIMSGWEFLEVLKDKGITEKNTIFIYMLSSSVNPDDMEKTKSNPNIINFVEKPLSEDFLKELIKTYSLK